jgi:AmmeMemoRadiSam system protein B
VARRVDRETADEILALEGPLHPRQACGAFPINGLLVAARRRGLTPRLLDLRSSGDIGDGAGDRGRVVGYGAFAFTEAA